MREQARSERWAPIPGHEGYEASDQGRIRSLPGVVRKQNGQTQRRRGQVLRTWPENGYLAVHLGAGRRYLVHRLVLQTFVGPCPKGMEGLHGNGDRGDSRLTNLRWGTASENALDRVKHGTCAMSRKTHCPLGHPLSHPNLCLSSLRRGVRECLACVRAKSRLRWLRKKGEAVIPTKQAEADRFYRLVQQGLVDPNPGMGRRPAAIEALTRPSE